MRNNCKKLFLLLGLVSSSMYLSAQKQASQWYFGQYAAIDFNSSTPKSINNSQLNSEEGCVSVADANGNLLFYTNGVKIWNRDHRIMPNGASLRGNASSTQSSLVIRSIDNPDKYYVFVVEREGMGGLSYSILDMSLDGGMGDILNGFKNIPLRNAVTEKLTAARHANGTDVWILSHDWGSNSFTAYLLSAAGIESTPVISSVGTSHSGNKANNQGAMKTSPDSKRIGLALEADHALELFDFDNKTGKVSNPIYIQLPISSYTYGIEFSPNSNILYASAAGAGKIYQYNVQYSKAEDIRKSQTVVASTPNGEWIGALQMSPNGKIYFPVYKTSSLGVINAPNKLGTACNAQTNAISFASNNSQGNSIARLGLPNYPAYYFAEGNNMPMSSGLKTVDVVNTKISDFDASKNKTLAKGETLRLKNLNFAVDKHEIKSTSYKELDDLVALLKKNPSYNLEIHGHTDNTGNEKHNLQLSKDRAKAVKDYLVKKGISANRLSTAGFGSSKPIVPNTTNENKLKNRRVVFSLK